MAGRASRIYNFCNSNPSSPGCPLSTYSPSAPPPTLAPPPINTQIAKVKEFLESNNAASKAPFSACTYGNAFTGYETFIGAGNAGPNGEPVDSTMYWRWASMTKLLGLLTLGAALEDGIIESINDLVVNYIPDLSNVTQYVTGSTLVDPPEYDQFGTPKYTQVLSDSDSELHKKITIKMLINSQSGFGYSFWGIGATRATFVDGLLNVFPTVQNYTAWLQNIETNTGYADTITSSYDKYGLINDKPTITYTQSIKERLKYPLLCDPGTTNIYDTGITFLGAVISAALAKKGIQQTAAEYTKSRILDPLGMTKTWLNCGALNPPSDVLTKLTNAFFVRKDTGNASGSLYKGDNVDYDTLYGCFDTAANGDGFKTQELDVFTQKKINNYLSNDSYAGGYDWSGCGTMSDFCKLLKLLINKGYNPATKKQILSKQTVEWILSSKYSLNTLAKGMNAPINNAINILDNGNTWCGGLSKFLDGSDEARYPFGPYTYSWGGYFGTTFIFDIQTGNYMVSGTQASAASWQMTDKGFQPNAPSLWKILTAM